MSRERQQGFENRQAFIFKVQEIQEFLTAKNIPYRILGSVAVSSYTDNIQLDFNRKDAFKKEQIVPDIDLLISRQNVRTVKTFAERLARDPRFPIKIDLTFPIAHIDFRPDEPESYLTHRSLVVAVKTNLFKPVSSDILGSPIVTVDPLTLFHTFVVWGGILRREDWGYILPLARYIRNTKQTQFTENDFANFHQFISLRNRYHPLYARGRKIMIETARWLPPKAEGFLRYYYKRFSERGSQINQRS